MVRTIMESRIHNRLPFAREGFPFILAALGITICFIWLDLTVLSILFGVLFLFVLYFFRDPERIHVNSEKGVLTPADGKIIEVKKLKEDMSPLGRPSIKISIFMSVFNVHVNRIPIGGTIKDTSYHPENFFPRTWTKPQNKMRATESSLKPVIPWKSWLFKLPASLQDGLSAGSGKGIGFKPVSVSV